MEVRDPDFPPEDGIGTEFWERFVQLSERAGKFMRLYTECAPYLSAMERNESIDPALAEKVFYCARGLDHFLPFLQKYMEFMRMVNETPMELVDPEVVKFIDSL